MWRVVQPDEDEAFVRMLAGAFGFAYSAERAARGHVPELFERTCIEEQGRIVGGMGAFAFDMTFPGKGPVPIEGVTVVGVLPTHRRRGILTSLMRKYMERARERGTSVAGLYASEASIYGRYGFGIATYAADIDIPREKTDFRVPVPATGACRFVDEEEALPLCTDVWNEVRRSTPAMLSRSPAWWQKRRLADPEYARAGKGALERVVWEKDGVPAAYALYRRTFKVEHNLLRSECDVYEVVGKTPEATIAMWRYVFDIDLVVRTRAVLLPLDHPLFYLLKDSRYLLPRFADSVWLRLLDVERGLSARAYSGPDDVVFGVTDAFCPWNDGAYRVSAGGCQKTTSAPEISIAQDDLSSTLMGQITFTALARAGRAVEHKPGALARADRLFQASPGPWCPEIF